MKTNFGISLLLLASAMSAVAFEDVQVTYRGRLKKDGAAPSAQTVRMTFRLYADKKDKSASWTMENQNVMIDDAGLFQVALRGEGLAEAIGSGLANWIGVTIDGGKEQYPRQALMASPRAEKAAVADRLASSPSVGTAAVERVKAGALSVGTLSVAGAVSIPPTATPASMNVRMTKPWYGLNMKGKVKFFSRSNPRDLGIQTVSGGGCSFGTADCNCVALFSSENSDIMPGMSLFVKKNGTIQVPASASLPEGTAVRCRMYPIGVE